MTDRRALDAYYTPTHLADRLVDVLPIDPADYVLEPHAGGGAFHRSLRGRCRVIPMDVDPDLGWRCGDFLADRWVESQAWDWVVGNPPYDAAEEHVRRALAVTRRHVVFLLRLAFFETSARVPFWAAHGRHLRRCWVLAQRPSFGRKVDGQESLFGQSVIDFDGRTDACAYGWFWFDLEHTGPSAVTVLSWK